MNYVVFVEYILIFKGYILIGNCNCVLLCKYLLYLINMVKWEFRNCFWIYFFISFWNDLGEKMNWIFNLI